MGGIQNSTWFRKFSETSTDKVFKSGETVSAQGEPLDTVSLIVSGKAALVTYSINGDETWAGEFSEGQFLGTLSLFTDEVSHFEIKAISKLVVRVISRNNILDLMRAEPSLCEALARDVSVRLNSTLSDLVKVHTLSVKGRICSELLRLALPIGINPDRQIIRPSPVFVALARRLNSTRETVSRTVSELQNKGILVREPGALVIAKPEQLLDAIEYF